MSLDDLILHVFCLVDDELHALSPLGWRQRGPAPVLADSEVITMELLGEWLGLDRDSRLFADFRQHHADAFPGLRQVQRTTWVRQAANLWAVKRTLQERLAHRLAGPNAPWLVDSMPVPACRFARATFCQRFAGQATYGHDHTLRQTFYGFRLHLRTSRDGVILAYALAPAHAAESAVLPELHLRSGTVGIGDRNYWSPSVQGTLAAAGITLQAPYRSKRRDPDPARSRRLSRQRWLIETVQGQLAERYNIKRAWARDLWHLCHRIIRKILSHTVAVWVNVTQGHQPLQLERLLAA